LLPRLKLLLLRQVLLLPLHLRMRLLQANRMRLTLPLLHLALLRLLLALLRLLWHPRMPLRCLRQTLLKAKPILLRLLLLL
jgi:hypothetical protein